MLDEAGKPAPGARIFAAAVPSEDVAARPAGERRPTGASSGVEVKSVVVETNVDADGRFRVELTGTGPFGIHVTAPGFAAVDLRDQTAATPIQVTLHPGRRLEGRVLDLAAAGRPLPSADVVARQSAGFQLEDPDQRDQFAPRALTDDRGRFELVDLKDVDYTLVARAEGRRAESRVVRIGGPPSATPLVFSLGRGITLSGRVVDQKGKGVADARIVALPGDLFGGMDLVRVETQTRTNAAGEFELGGLPVGAYTVLARRQDFAEAWTTGVRAPDGRRASGIVLTLAQGSTLKASLRVGDQPFAGAASVSAVYDSAGPDFARTVRRSTEDCKVQDGVLFASNLPSGRADVTLQAEGFKPVEVEKILVKAGEPVDLGAFALERGPRSGDI